MLKTPSVDEMNPSNLTALSFFEKMTDQRLPYLKQLANNT